MIICCDMACFHAHTNDLTQLISSFYILLYSLILYNVLGHGLIFVV